MPQQHQKKKTRPIPNVVCRIVKTGNIRVFLPFKLQYFSKLNSISTPQCFPKPEKIGPYAKFDRKIEQNSVTGESTEWKEFFDYIEKKEEIGCKKIVYLGKKIHCIFAFAQKWQFSEEFKGYFIGQENFKEIHDEIRHEIRHSAVFLNNFERSLQSYFDWLKNWYFQ